MNTQTSSGSEIPNAHIVIKQWWIPIIYLLLLLFQSCSAESEIVTIDVHRANSLLNNDKYRYLDVRTSEEFMKGRVKNVNFSEQVLLLCKKDDHLVVGCQSGVRSVYATTILLDAGFKHVYNMGGGYLAWVENGLPVAVVTPKVEL
ncbi:unnamed protein product [Lactuca virosa]|uniref:Rhodanese domain-containing protein n=1 Tax=Lactuca virosa TaxID=75947 RepID=A0AAU9NH37_9ASTR|nr:unnamed protein product [Lactuca virosa]